MSGIVNRFQNSFWKLRQHALDRHHQDPAASASRHKFAHEDARLDSLSEAHIIGDQNALPRLPQRLTGRLKLIRHLVHRGLLRYTDELVAWHRPAQQTLHVEQAASEMGRRVGDERGSCGVKNSDLVLEPRQEYCFPFAHQFGDACAGQLRSAIGRDVDSPNDPFGVPNDDASASRRRGGGGQE